MKTRIFHHFTATALAAVVLCTVVVTQNLAASTEAVEMMRERAEKGEAVMQFTLGFAHLLGDGVSKNKQEGVRWLRKSAEQGFAQAQDTLGVAYLQGQGVAKDTREAVRWFHKAAEQGLAQSQFRLGGAYYIGNGVITDKRESYIWLSIANANGNEDASQFLRDINWREDLSQSEIRSAQKEAKQRMEKIDHHKAKHEKKIRKIQSLS